MSNHTSNGKPRFDVSVFNPISAPNDGVLRLDRTPFEELQVSHPNLNTPVIAGWIREREVANIIAAPKFGKSWFALYISLCIVTGRPVFGRFPVKAGKVLLIDLELHESVIVDRVQSVASAMGLVSEDYASDLEVVALRGQCVTINELLVASIDIAQGEYSAIIVDSKYRLEGVKDENANSETTAFYNRANQLAEATGAAILFVHHQTKGDQSGKRVTDIGSGGGAQSRAADTHLVLREHDQPGVAVVEAALRSFPPLQPLAIRWQFPLWVVDEQVNVGQLKGRLSAGAQRQRAEDKKGRDAIVKALRAGPLRTNVLCQKASMGKERFNRLIGLLEETGQVIATTIKVSHNDAVQYSLNDSEMEGGPEPWTTRPDHQTA